MKKDIELQRIRVSSGWSIDINNFYEVDPIEEYMEYFYNSVLISGENRRMGLSFDSRYEPEGEPDGFFYLILQKNEYDKKGRMINVSVLDIKKEKNRQVFTEYLEKFMKYGEC